jgi:hypothetical protein
MELILLWLGINALIGYALGKPKNEVGASILICILLGPIGWLLCILNKGKLRKCPYCAEDVKPEAVVCRHCGRDLPVTTEASVPDQRKWTAMDTTLVIGIPALLGAIGWYAMNKHPQQAQPMPSTSLSQLHEDTLRAQRKLAATEAANEASLARQTIIAKSRFVQSIGGYKPPFPIPETQSAFCRRVPRIVDRRPGVHQQRRSFVRWNQLLRRSPNSNRLC